MIESITIEGFRNQKKSTITLGQRNLIVGPNGSGKTTHVAGLQWLLNGCLPGHGPADAFLNASGDSMYASATINGRLLERRLTKGKTLSETIVLDGSPMKVGRGGADGVIQAAFGTKPLVMDMIAFQRMTSTEQRRSILGMVCTPQELATLTDNETKARDAKNDGDRKKREAQATLATLTAELSAIKERPTGNIDQIRAELATVNKGIKDTITLIESGLANDRARLAYQDAKDSIAQLEEQVVQATEALEAARAELAERHELVTILEKSPPEPPPGPRYTLPEEAEKDVRAIMVDFKAMKDAYPAEIKTLYEPMKAIFVKLKGMLGNEKESGAHKVALKAYLSKHAEYTANKDAASAACTKASQRVTQTTADLAAAKKAITRGDGIGAGINDEQQATLNGLQGRKDVLEEKAQALDRVGVLTQQIDKARLAVEKAEQEAAAKVTALNNAIAAQKDVVMEARGAVQNASATILPNGFADIEDDGKNIHIVWKRGREENIIIPWETLSGGEKAMFDCALGYALSPTAIVIIEGAEVDDANMGDLLVKMGECDFQVAILTCHPPTKEGLLGGESLMYPVDEAEWSVHRLAQADAGEVSGE